jgi:hypothetical protein
MVTNNVVAAFALGVAAKHTAELNFAEPAENQAGHPNSVDASMRENSVVDAFAVSTTTAGKQRVVEIIEDVHRSIIIVRSRGHVGVGR